MALLESAMAFAVVMMIFSTIVTGIVQAILSLLGTREKTLQKTVEALFQKVIWPRLSDRLDNVRPFEAPYPNVLTKGMAWLLRNQSNTETVKKRRQAEVVLLAHGAEQAHKARFLQDLTENPVFQQEKGIINRLIGRNKSKIDSLSLLSFAERLGKTDVGKAIVVEGEQQTDLLVQDLVRGFDRFSRAASEVFRKKAQLTAICVAIPLAMFANVDAARLFTQLIENPEIRASLIEQAEEANKENQDAVKSLQEVQKALETLPTNATESGNEPVVESAEGAAANDVNGEAQLAKLQQDLATVSDNVRESVKKMEAGGLKIGWSWYPWCAPDNEDPMCHDRVFRQKKIEGSHKLVTVPWVDIFFEEGFRGWLVMTILAGILIGLGGPFWFKVFTGLAQVFQTMRALGIGGRKAAEGTEPDPKQVAENSAKPKDVLDAFKVAVKATVPPKSRSRALLDANGQPL